MSADLIVSKITDLLLNRVENLQWYYFEMNLDELIAIRRAAPSVPGDPSDEMKPVLAQITPGPNGNFTYNVESNLLPMTGSLARLESKHLLALLEYLRLNPEIMNAVMKRIFDINQVLQDSSTVQAAQQAINTGALRTLNRLEHQQRKKTFEKIFRKKPDFRSGKKNMVVLAEGDSWYCFPKIHIPGFRWLFKDAVHDILDHLIDNKECAVYSLAAGGDWLNNMLDETNQHYVENLSKLRPDAFLVSGGGNDLVEDKRITHMVRLLPLEGRRNLHSSQDKDPLAYILKHALLHARMNQNPRPIDSHLYNRGIDLLSDDFFRFINVCMVQYFALFYRLLIKTDKFNSMMILTHGYDFPVPTKKRKGWFWQWKRIINSDYAMNNGKWLHDALAMRGISDPEDQRAATYVMIYEFNEMLCKLANFSWFPNVFHIDCRNVAQTPDDWFDELHLKSHAFKKIANTFRETIMKYRQIFKDAAEHNAFPKINFQDKIQTVQKI